MRIWIADDSAADRERLSKILGQRKNLVKAFSGATDLLRELEVQEAHLLPDLFILDVVMPVMSGFEACRFLQGDPRYSDIPVVLCSVKNLATDRMWAREQGAAAYLSKPLSAEQLWLKVDAVMKKHARAPAAEARAT